MNWISGIIIPLLAAIVGGLITFVGVKLTIKNQHASDETKRKQSIKPWIFAVPPVTDNCSPCELKSDKEGISFPYYLHLKNTDNGIAIIDSVISKNNIYRPITPYIIEKNADAAIRIKLITDEDETMEMAEIARPQQVCSTDLALNR